MCTKDYKKCELKKTTCPKPDWANWAPVGTKVAWNRAGYCRNPPGLSSTASSSTFTPTVVNATCLDCASPKWRPNTQGIKFCDLLKQAQDVAATAVQEDAVNSGCEHPAGVKLTLARACITQKGYLPYFATYGFVADVCGMHINVAVEQKGSYSTSGAGWAAKGIARQPESSYSYSTWVLGGMATNSWEPGR